ncbi:MAG: diacylglycerol kinase family protein [Acidimicrobiia bacterium]|nr:diacylglycerol kinase family protein [Acidimicrobiia bacterium]
MKRLLLIANPSSSGFTGAAFRDVEATLSDGYAVTTVWPNGPAESRQAAADAAADGYTVVAAMGGDGVVHHVANGLAFTGTSLGVIPTGTTNVVARLLGVPLRAKTAAARLLGGHRRFLSLAHIATESPLAARSEYAVFSLGMGLDADVVAASDLRPTAKYYFASLSFAATATNQVVRKYRTRPADMVVECGGWKVHASSVLVQVHDLYTYWGPVPLRLTPEHGDGPTALAVERLSVSKAASLAARGLLRQRMERQRGANVFHEFEKLIVHAEPAAAFQADGEYLGKAESVEITPAYDALPVIAPGRE